MKLNYQFNPLLAVAACVIVVAAGVGGFWTFKQVTRPDRPDTCIPENGPNRLAQAASEVPFSNWTDRGEIDVGLYDPVVFVEHGRDYPYRVLASDDDGMVDVYKTRSLTSGPYKLVKSDIEGDEGGSNFNWGRKVDRTYYLFRTLHDEQTELWTGNSLTNLTNHGVVLNESDTGGFYDDETGMWHIYYEAIDVPKSPSGDALVHATSTDARQWAKQGIALNASDKPWHTGDADIHELNGTYYIFFDQTENHPRYHIGLATSQNLSSFDIQGRVPTVCGGDPVVRYAPTEGQWVMLTEYAGSDLEGVGVKISPSPDSVPANESAA